MTSLSALQALDAYFLEARAKLLDLAAFLDRMHRGENSARAKTDPRVQRIEKALKILLESDGADRAAQIQQIFSLEYDPSWKVPQPRY